MDSFIAWLGVSLSGGFVLLIYKLWVLWNQYRDGKFQNEIKQFQSDTDLGEKRIHDKIQGMSDADLESSAKSVDSGIRNKK